MIEVKQIDKTQIQVKAEIPNVSYAANVYYQLIKVDNLNSLVDGEPSEKAAVIPISELTKVINVILNTLEIDNALLSNGVLVDSDNIYYIYAVNNGEFNTATTPCGKDSMYECMAAWNDARYLKQGLSYLKTFGDNCGKASPSPEFINFILQNKAMELANTVGNMTLLNSYWSNFTISASGVKSTSKCGCNG